MLDGIFFWENICIWDKPRNMFSKTSFRDTTKQHKILFENYFTVKQMHLQTIIQLEH